MFTKMKTTVICFCFFLAPLMVVPAFSNLYASPIPVIAPKTTELVGWWYGGWHGGYYPYRGYSYHYYHPHWGGYYYHPYYWNHGYYWYRY